MDQTRMNSTINFQDKLDEGERLHATLWKIIKQEQQKKQNNKIERKTNELLKTYEIQIRLLIENLEILNDSQYFAGEQLRGNAIIQKLEDKQSGRKLNDQDFERVTGLIKEIISARTNIDLKSIVEFECDSHGRNGTIDLLQQLNKHSQQFQLTNHHESAELKNRIIKLIEKIQTTSTGTNDQLDKLIGDSINLFSDYFHMLRKFGSNNENEENEENEMM